MTGAKKRILLAKMGLDSHDTGIVTVAQMLRNAGHEIIYVGLHNYAEQVVNAAIQDDVDAIGISFLSGQHETQMAKLLQAMREAELNVPVVCGGVIPAADADELKQMGVAAVIFPGSLSEDVVAAVEAALA